MCCVIVQSGTEVADFLCVLSPRVHFTSDFDFSILILSSSWGGSLKSAGSIRSENSMHGLLTDDQEAEDSIELQGMRNANGGGVDVSFQGL